MSSGPFTDTRYAADSGDVYGITVQPETLSLTIATVANDPPAGPVDQPVLARVSGSRRGYGVFARTARVRVTAAGTSGLTIGSVITLPLLNGDIYDVARKPNTGTYNTATVAVVGRSPERIR